MNVDEKPDNVSLLLTEAEVRSIDGLSEVVAQELAGAPLSENPDPRGPCGAAVPQSPTAGAAGRTFAGSGLTIVQKIVETGVEQHTFLVSLQSDEHIGCAPYRSTTSAGQSQSVSEITFLEQAANNGPGIAWTARADVPGGTGYFGSSVVEVNGRSSFVSIFSLTPIHTATLAALVQLAADKLSA